MIILTQNLKQILIITVILKFDHKKIVTKS